MRIKFVFYCLLALSVGFTSCRLNAEPWIDIRDVWLRADIEALSDVGIIKVPVNTYPLMWSGIIRDIDSLSIEEVPANYQAAFLRIKRAGKDAMYLNNRREIRVSVSNNEQVLRSFGDDSRGKVELSARRIGMSKYFAWNIEVTRQNNAFDGDSVRYDGSYIAGTYKNWNVSVGAIEKWWGAGWNSSNLLSNNARPPLAVTVQRNYSYPIDKPILNWLGPWTFNSFVAHLDDERTIKHAKLIGASLSFKPHQSLEVALRAAALWGGKQVVGYDEEGKQTIHQSRPESFDSFIDNIIGNKVCEVESNTLCSNEYYSDSGDRIAGLEFRWSLPVNYPLSVYASAYGENETDFLPSKNMLQWGITSSFDFFNTNWKWFIEKSDTALDKKEFNRAYESSIYQNGYRYNRRAIGSTFDNDSEVSSLGIMSQLNRQHSIRFDISNIELNKNTSDTAAEKHSITKLTKEFKLLKLNWRYQTRNYGKFVVSVEYTNAIYDQFERINDKARLSVDWFYNL